MRPAASVTVGANRSSSGRDTRKKTAETQTAPAGRPPASSTGTPRQRRVFSFSSSLTAPGVRPARRTGGRGLDRAFWITADHQPIRLESVLQRGTNRGASSMRFEDILNGQRLVPELRSPNPAQALLKVSALVAAGCAMVEFTTSVPGWAASPLTPGPPSWSHRSSSPRSGPGERLRRRGAPPINPAAGGGWL